MPRLSILLFGVLLTLAVVTTTSEALSALDSNDEVFVAKDTDVVPSSDYVDRYT